MNSNGCDGDETCLLIFVVVVVYEDTILFMDTGMVEETEVYCITREYKAKYFSSL